MAAQMPTNEQTGVHHPPSADKAGDALGHRQLQVHLMMPEQR
jgi:hypothetical protein